MTAARAIAGVCATAVLLMFTGGAARAGDPLNGQRLYSEHCAACHGANGMAVMPGAPNFARGDRLVQPDMSLLPTIKMGKRAMPAFLGRLTDREILDVISHIRTLYR